MQKFIETILSALKTWMRHDAFTADDAFELAMEMEVVEPVRAVDGTIYTSPEGEIYTL